MSHNAIYLLPSPRKYQLQLVPPDTGQGFLQLLPPQRAAPLPSLTWFLPFPAFHGQFIQMLMVIHINNPTHSNSSV